MYTVNLGSYSEMLRKHIRKKKAGGLRSGSVSEVLAHKQEDLSSDPEFR